MEDPMLWASLCKTHTEWMRHIAPQLGFDTPRVIKGMALASIIGDDENSFGFFFMKAEWGEMIEKQIFERMDWEVNLPEVPENIKEQIRKTQKKLTEINFDNKEEYDIGRAFWKKHVRNFTNHQLALNKNLREDLDYSHEANKKWSPYWWDFLGEKRLADL
jgi:hypothetical protein